MMRRGASVVRAGDFDALIRIEQNSVAGQQDSGTGEPSAAVWTLWQEAWAQVETLRGRELRDAMRETSEQFTTFWIQYIDPLPDETMRVVWESVAYDIRAIEHVEGGRRLVGLTCRKVV